MIPPFNRSSKPCGPSHGASPDATTVIFNADDVGYSWAINDVVIRAHGQGALTSASMMIAGDAAQTALARELHLVVAGGHACRGRGVPSEERWVA